MQSIHLKASGFILRFEIQSNGWTTVFLESNHQSVELGAEFNTILFRKLRTFLEIRTEQKEIAGEIENTPVAHIFSLFERHTSVYGSLNAQKPILFFQSPEGEVFAKIRLTHDELAYWTKQLEV
jgi:hypothetical protein